MHSLLALWPPPCQAMIPPGSSLFSSDLLCSKSKLFHEFYDLFQAPFWEWNSSHTSPTLLFSPSLSLFFLPFFCILLHMPPPPGRFWTCPIPSARRNSGQSRPAGRLHSVVLRADNFMSSQPGPPCFHSLG
jgi:hypothetical protein